MCTSTANNMFRTSNGVVLMSCVLVVEDDLDIQLMIAELLTAEGYHVLLVKDGQTAIETTHMREPALILMDIHLPVLDGAEAIRRLKADATTQHIPIIAMSAMPQPQDSPVYQLADIFLSKPFDINVFLAIVESMTRNIGCRD
jgi:two-component system, cell cycle response regulator DivK